jgi:1-acyl-sn-glycerol-3-phosphate acyltransferase
MRAPDATQLIGAGPDLLTWRRPAAAQIAGCPLPHLGLGDRLLLRAAAMCAARHIVAIDGLQYVRPAQDPFILAANHSTRREALLVPAMLLLHRGGSRVHFLADWNFRLIPGVGLLYARAQVITVTRKSAKPRTLNMLKRFYQHPQSALERARARLAAGHAVGIFPEGEVNRNPTRLLRGRRGAARLSLETGVPVVPMGIRFPGGAPGRALAIGSGMELRISAPLLPPGPIPRQASLSEVSAWHRVIMSEIARLSGKAWVGA